MRLPIIFDRLKLTAARGSYRALPAVQWPVQWQAGCRSICEDMYNFNMKSKQTLINCLRFTLINILSGLKPCIFLSLLTPTLRSGLINKSDFGL